MIDLAEAADWEAMRAGFRWRIPERCSIAWDACDRWAEAEPERLAMIVLDAAGRAEEWRFGRLAAASRRLAHALAAAGVGRGDRVALLLAQGAEAMLTHLACYRLGAVVVPLFTLFGTEALEFRLADSGAMALVTDRANWVKVAPIRDRLPLLDLAVTVDGPAEGARALLPMLEAASDRPIRADLGPEDPAFISYTSGTTGPPKGALHAQRVLLGHLPATLIVHDWPGRAGDRFWTPADWAWMGGLCNVALPALCLGVPLVAHRFERFDPERAADLIGRLAVRNVFLPPTALKLMRAAGPKRIEGLRTIGSGGESLGAEMLDWGREAFGLSIHEFYGQTECNLCIGSNARLAPLRPGWMGRAIPGSEVAILDAEGRSLPAGETGEIAVRRGAAAMFLGYWNRPDKTAQKFAGDWMLTGDEGVRDAAGCFRFASRADDVITSSGYRIGPTEIEHCLTGHPAVAMAAVVGVPDPVRTEIVKAVVVLRDGAVADDALAEALKAHVRARLGPHLAPRLVAFADRLPITATGKIMRRELRHAPHPTGGGAAGP